MLTSKYSSIPARIRKTSTIFSILMISTVLCRDISAETTSHSRQNVINIRMGPYNFRVPENYIHSYYPQKLENGPAAFSISVLLPNYSPINHENENEFTKPGFNNVVTAFVFYKHGYGDNKRIKKVYENEIEKSIPSDKIGMFNHYVMNNGLFKDLYEYNKDKKYYMFICSDDDVPDPGCESLINIGKDLEISYSYDKKLLEKSVQIQDAIEKIIYHFRVNE